MEVASLPGRTALALVVIIALQVPVSLWLQQWLDAALCVGVVIFVATGLATARTLRLYVPAGLQLLVIAFLFAWLFLGYVHNYFSRFTWWDTLLHVGASALASLAAFLLVHVFNRCDEFGSRTRPGLLAVFTFVFGVAIGAFWEIFEFGVDHFLGGSMQEPVAGDASGLTDTISDLTYDTLGALAVSLYVYYHLKRQPHDSLLKSCVNAFIRGNPRLFGRTH
jgi:uncharacterized membrane protein YjdF